MNTQWLYGYRAFVDLKFFKPIIILLETNISRVQRELLKLLEECEANECFICNRLRCCCSDSSSLRSSTLSCLSSLTSSNDSLTTEMLVPEAPPAYKLPAPEFDANSLFTKQEHTEVWVKTSAPTTKRLHNWPKSIWNNWDCICAEEYNWPVFDVDTPPPMYNSTVVDFFKTFNDVRSRIYYH